MDRHAQARLGREMLEVSGHQDRPRGLGGPWVSPAETRMLVSRPQQGPGGPYRSSSPAMMFMAPSTATASAMIRPRTCSSKLLKMGKQGGRTWIR